METKGIELDKEREKSIHAKNIIIPMPINSTHFHTTDTSETFMVPEVSFLKIWTGFVWKEITYYLFMQNLAV